MNLNILLKDSNNNKFKIKDKNNKFKNNNQQKYKHKNEKINTFLESNTMRLPTINENDKYEQCNDNYNNALKISHNYQSMCV